MDRRRGIGIALVVLSACGYGSGALFAKPVYGAGLDWLTLLAWRFGIGAALSWIWLLSRPSARRSLRHLSRRHLIVAIGLGLLFTLNSSTYYAAVQTIPASLAALIVYIYPVLVAVMSIRFGRPLEGRGPWFALGLATIGVTLAVGGIQASTAPPLAGLLQAIASPIIYAVWIVLSARLAGERSDRVGGDTAEDDADAGAQTSAASAVIMTSTWLVFLVLAAAGNRPVLPADVPSAAWPGLLGVGAISTFLAIQGFYEGTRRIGAANAALISTVEPVWTIVLATLLFAEHLQPIQLAGGGLIIIAVIVAQTASAAAPRPAMRLADE